MAQDYYKTLGVSKNASQDDIQKAYRELARKYHPDLNQADPEGAKRKFQEVQEAFETLKDPEKRKQYDQYGDAYRQFGAGGPGGFNGTTFRWSSNGGGGSFNMDDILRQFTGGVGGAGGANPFSGAFGFGKRARRPSKGADSEATIEIPFKTAVLGCKTPILVRDPVSGKSSSHDLDIPAGSSQGDVVSLKGYGQPGLNGGPRGDLLIKLKVAPHAFYTRDGKDLRVTLPISIPEAARGGKIDVPTPYGVVAVKIPEGATTGTKLRIKGFGVRTGKGLDGDLYVVCELHSPKKWRKEDVEKLAKMKLDMPELRAKFEF